MDPSVVWPEAVMILTDENVIDILMHLAGEKVLEQVTYIVNKRGFVKGKDKNQAGPRAPPIL